MKPRCHQTSVSDHSCNRNLTCQCDVQTHFSSVYDDRSSTQLLYIGKSFHCKENDEGREFKDCSSDTEMHKKPSNQLQPPKLSASPSECTNYKQMLKQIINMSQKVLDRIEKKEKKKSMDKPCHSGRKPSAASCAMSIHVEPVQLAIPVTIHFQPHTMPSTSVPCASITGSAVTQKSLPCVQSQTLPCNQPSLQRSIQFGAQKDIECNLQESIVMQPNKELNAPVHENSTMAEFDPSKCVSKTFPISIQTQNEACVSQGKFPQLHPPTESIPNPDNSSGKLDMLCVSTLNNRPEPEPPSIPQYKAENIMECDMDDKRDLEETDEKASQTDRRHGRKKEFQEKTEKPLEIFLKADNDQPKPQVESEAMVYAENLPEPQAEPEKNINKPEVQVFRRKELEEPHVEAKEEEKRESKFNSQGVQTLTKKELSEKTEDPKVVSDSGAEILPNEPKVEPTVPPKPPAKMYRLALPQHRDLDLCTKCRFHPSPLFDSDGHAFCPGGCGCCLCPWKSVRNSGQKTGHETLKICNCRERLTIFSSSANDRITCSAASFDVCPCQEKAQAKFLEMTSHEMFTPDNALTSFCFGAEVLLSDVDEIKTKL